MAPGLGLGLGLILRNGTGWRDKHHGCVCLCTSKAEVQVADISTAELRNLVGFGLDLDSVRLSRNLCLKSWFPLLLLPHPALLLFSLALDRYLQRPGFVCGGNRILHVPSPLVYDCSETQPPHLPSKSIQSGSRKLQLLPWWKPGQVRSTEDLPLVGAELAFYHRFYGVPYESLRLVSLGLCAIFDRWYTSHHQVPLYRPPQGVISKEEERRKKQPRQGCAEVDHSRIDIVSLRKTVTWLCKLSSKGQQTSQ